MAAVQLSAQQHTTGPPLASAELSRVLVGPGGARAVARHLRLLGPPLSSLAPDEVLSQHERCICFSSSHELACSLTWR